jgi:hypothetical protein
VKDAEKGKADKVDKKKRIKENREEEKVYNFLKSIILIL